MSDKIKQMIEEMAKRAEETANEVSEYLGQDVADIRYEEVFLLLVRKMKEIEAKVDSNG